LLDDDTESSEGDKMTKSTSTYKCMQILSKTENRQPHLCAYHLTTEDTKTRMANK